MIDGMVAPSARSPRPSWTASSRPARLLLALAAVLALVTVLLPVQGLRRQPEHRVRLVAAPAVPAVDPAPPAMLAALRRTFPGSRLTTVTGVSEAATGRPLRLTILVQLDPATTLVLTAQRLPGVSANDPDSTDGAGHGHQDLSGNTVVDDTTMQLVVGGRPGCSVSLVLHSPGENSRFTDPTVQLARDPAVQLTP
jgi:hypothetical protein